MSVWQFETALAGYVEAHSSSSGGMSEREKDEVWEWMQSKGDVPRS